MIEFHQKVVSETIQRSSPLCDTVLQIDVVVVSFNVKKTIYKNIESGYVDGMDIQ